MRFHYISPSILPSRAANSVHVVWQCDGLCRAGVEVSLYAKRAIPDAAALADGLKESYGVEQKALRLDTVYSTSTRGDNLRIARHAIAAVRQQGREVGILSRNLYAAFVLAVLDRIPLLFETHQLESGVRKWMQRAVMRCPWVTTIAISDHLVEYLHAHHGVEPRRHLVLHDAAPEGITPISPRERRAALCEQVRQALGSWRMVCGYFGHLYPGRGIEIVEQLSRARPDCLFLVYGGTERDLDERRLGNRLGNLIFMGHVPHPRARELMAQMDVLLMPYQESVSIGVKGHDTARWMSPMKMFEYLGAGVPILSSDLPVLREILVDGDNCLLAPPADPQSWLDALDRVARSPGLSVALGERAHAQYRAHHTWTRRAERILEAARGL